MINIAAMSVACVKHIDTAGRIVPQRNYSEILSSFVEQFNMLLHDVFSYQVTRQLPLHVFSETLSPFCIPSTRSFLSVAMNRRDRAALASC